MIDKKYMDRYAKLLLKFGVAFQKGQKLVLEIPAEAKELAESIQKEAAERGARSVSLFYVDDTEDAALLLRDQIAFEAKMKDYREKLEKALEGDSVSLAFVSPVPSVARILKAEQQQEYSEWKNDLRNVVRKAIRGRRIQWCYACCPNSDWAMQVYPECSREQALEKLWEKTVEFCYLDREDPVETWLSCYDSLYRRTKWLNSLALESIHFWNHTGTDITVGLNPRCIWEGGLERESYDGTFYQCNLPSYEICTTTHKTRTNGKVSASRPLYIHGSRVENFTLKFQNGRLVEIQAETGKEILETVLSKDEGCHYLGEIAFVEKDVPIAKSGMVFGNTLLDENAACHMALGCGFPGNIEGIDSKDLIQVEKSGVNLSDVHLDFMFGTDDLCADGYCENGTVVKLFRNGKFY